MVLLLPDHGKPDRSIGAKLDYYCLAKFLDEASHSPRPSSMRALRETDLIAQVKALCPFYYTRRRLKIQRASTATTVIRDALKGREIDSRLILRLTPSI